MKIILIFFLDICVVDSSHIEQGKTFYVGVVCEGHCRYSLKSIYEMEYTIGISTYFFNKNYYQLDDEL